MADKGDTAKIAEIIAAYKADFDRVKNDEIYKWQAIRWYKEHWNIDAADFAAMFTSAFSKAGNLLAANMYYPYKMICIFSEMHPEEVRKMFKDLYNEERPLSERYSNFRRMLQRLMRSRKTRKTTFSLSMKSIGAIYQKSLVS